MMNTNRLEERLNEERENLQRLADYIESLPARYAYFCECYRSGYCFCHGEPQERSRFRDDVSWAEFRISLLCQETQDSIFGPDEDEEAL